VCSGWNNHDSINFDTETHKLHGDIIEAAGMGVVFHEIGGIFH
jgi:hypothetical protein